MIRRQSIGRERSGLGLSNVHYHEFEEESGRSLTMYTNVWQLIDSHNQFFLIDDSHHSDLFVNVGMDSRFPSTIFSGPNSKSIRGRNTSIDT